VRHSSQNANSLGNENFCQTFSGVFVPKHQQELHSLQNPRQIAGGFVEVDAFAKINLFLEVVGKRSDGYHELISVMQAVNLCDSLVIQKLDNTAGPVQLDINTPNLPTGDKNLVVKAAKLLMQEYNIAQPIHIKLTKRIPIGAGLGGGSSDCAATLHGLNQLFELKISLDRLMEMGATLGADVPFCLLANTRGGTALAKGIGEKLTPLPPHPNCYVVLACPPIHVSTKKIFSKLRLNAKNINYKLDKFMSAYKTQDIAQIAENFKNTFTSVTSSIHPQISNLITDLQNQGALGAEMTGTGSAVFAYFNNENNAKKTCDILQAVHTDTKFFITCPI